MTIGFNELGKHGRLGNQMFQYAALVGIAKQCGFDFVIPDHSKANRFDYYNGTTIVTEHHRLQHCFEMLHCGNRYGTIDGDEVKLHDSHEFCEELFNHCPNHITLNGYFQTEKYFKNSEKLIRLDFRFKQEIVDEVEFHYGYILQQNPVSICLRDYNNTFDYPGCSNNHRNLPWSYFDQAIEMLGRDRLYIVCSNNLELSRKYFNGDNFIINDIQSKVEKQFFDLCLISKCKDFIISNSTFSWWGAWLANCGRVIAPTPWYGEGLSHINTDDLYPEKWEKIKC